MTGCPLCGGTAVANAELERNMWHTYDCPLCATPYQQDEENTR